MSDRKTRQIVYGVLEFLSQEFQKSTTTADSKESLEVATQCLETAFGISLQNVEYKSPQTLRELYGPATPEDPPAPGTGSVRFIELGEEYNLPAEASEESKIAAEEYKNQGNEAMKNLNYTEALGYYTKSVELDGRNSVYFCNRAAAYIKIEDYENALRDCQIAVRLQPNYARAYGRMGVTYSNQNKLVDSILCYKKAVELEPSNESYINNLRYSQSLLMNELPGGQNPGGAAGPNLQSFFNNPSLINMASQMLQDPSMQQMMQNLMSGFQQGQGDQQGANPMDNLLEMGQAIANQIRTANPQLAEQLGVATNPLGNPGAGGDPNSGNDNSGNPGNGNNL